MNMKFWNYGNARVSRPMSRVLAALGISILAYFHTSAIAYCGEAAPRWSIAAPRERIEWDVAADAQRNGVGGIVISIAGDYSVGAAE